MLLPIKKLVLGHISGTEMEFGSEETHSSSAVTSCGRNITEGGKTI